MILEPQADTLFVLAGLVAAFIVVAMIAALAELFATLISRDASESPWPSGGDLLDHGIAWVVIAAAFIGSWLIWSFILLIFTREIWADRMLGRIVHVLLAGTVIELLVIIPIDIMVRRRTDCYCATGTFWSLALAATAVLWLAGPGVFIAAMSKRHRAVRERYCIGCGHAKGPTPGECCPECGCDWHRV